MLTFDKSYGKHDLNALAGFMDEIRRADFTIGYRQNFLGTELQELDLGDVSGQQATGGAQKLILRSWFGRLNYAFDGKYLFEANVRRDGTSRFVGENKWNTFPSFSAGWRVSQESFFQNSSLGDKISELKLRGGWGILGNQTLSCVGENAYPSADSYYPGIYTISSGYNYPLGTGLSSGGTVAVAANPAMLWERSISSNIGLDLNLRNNWGFVVDYFNRTTDRLYMSLPVPVEFGLPSPVQNAGKVKNSGVELQLNYSNRTNPFKFDIGANVSYLTSTMKS